MECPAQRQEYKFFRRFHHPEGRDKKPCVDAFENAGGIYAQSHRYDQPDEPAGQCRYVEVEFVI